MDAYVCNRLAIGMLLASFWLCTPEVLGEERLHHFVQVLHGKINALTNFLEGWAPDWLLGEQRLRWRALKTLGVVMLFLLVIGFLAGLGFGIYLLVLYRIHSIESLVRHRSSVWSYAFAGTVVNLLFYAALVLVVLGIAFVIFWSLVMVSTLALLPLFLLLEQLASSSTYRKLMLRFGAVLFHVGLALQLAATFLESEA
ncbi:hypothetical protein [Streptomyces sp. 8N616]|uniref:hypothetical protein n=1 Tax=Streptomyces sp. 8N616 TaxID=3457414 RepID=UPI003FCF6B5D